MNDSQKSNMGRPVKNVIEPIDASPQDIAKALFRDADKRIVREKTQKNSSKKGELV